MSTLPHKQILDKTFELMISEADIQQRIKELANRINTDLAGRDVIFIGILNGAFMFAADLFRNITLDCQITFLKLASYQGTMSSGNVKRLIGLSQDLTNKTVVVLEDIVDTGVTLEHIRKQLNGYEPAEVRFATLLFKPEAYTKTIPLDYVAMEIPNNFVVGYGLDYDGYGRNLREIYTLVK